MSTAWLIQRDRLALVPHAIAAISPDEVWIPARPPPAFLNGQVEVGS